MVITRTIRRRAFLVTLTLAGLVAAAACGDAAPSEPAGAAPAAPTTTESGASTRSVATGREQGDAHFITEADAGTLIQTEHYVYDIGLPDRQGLVLILTGDDASTLRWRFAAKPDPSILEWYAVDGALAFETDGLIGNSATAATTLEFRGNVRGTTVFVLELVELDPADRLGEPAKRLEYSVEVVRSYRCSTGDAFADC